VNRSHAAELDRVPAPALVIVAVLSVQLGAAVAKSLFDDLTPTGVVALRLVFGGLVLGLLFRPRIRTARGPSWLASVRPRARLDEPCFFQALDRIPLGIAVTLEFIGPLGAHRLARSSDFLSRHGRLRYRPGTWDRKGPDAVGVAFALAAGVPWGAYILRGVRVGKASRSDGSVLAMGVGARGSPVGVAVRRPPPLEPVPGGGSARCLVGDPAVARARGAPPPAHAGVRVLMSSSPRSARVGFVVLGERLDPGGDGDRARGRQRRCGARARTAPAPPDV
jgi:inner membrane transporter RhtA